MPSLLEKAYKHVYIRKKEEILWKKIICRRHFCVQLFSIPNPSEIILNPTFIFAFADFRMQRIHHHNAIGAFSFSFLLRVFERVQRVSSTTIPFPQLSGCRMTTFELQLHIKNTFSPSVFFSTYIYLHFFEICQCGQLYEGMLIIKNIKQKH